MTKNKSKPIAILLAGLQWVGLCQAQESVNTSGGDATGSGGSAAYSIGQVAYTTYAGSNGTAAQGVQQAYEIFSVGINETALDISISVFPNPTDENLTLKISDYKNERLSYQLHELQGKQLISGQILAQQTQININNLPAASYFLSVVNQENKKVQSFKIIKK